jgi:hypothetical protein
MRVASILEEVQSLQDKRSALYQSFDDAVNKFKSTKDAQSFSNSRKKIDADYKQLTQQIQGLQSQLKNEGADIAEKVHISLFGLVFMVLNATFNNISVISWLSVLLEETGVPEENHQPVASH